VVSSSGLRFVVVGDTTLDVTVRGGVPEPGADRPAGISLGLGGQGANVAVRLARRGFNVRLVTAIGTDPTGAQLTTLLTEEGVEVLDLGAEQSGIVIALVDGSGERAMVSSRASMEAAAWTDAGAGRASLADAGWIHVSGYPLLDPDSGAALAEAVGARRADQRASVGGGSSATGSVLAERLQAARPDLLVFDRGEGLAALHGRAKAAAPGTMGDLADALTIRYGAIAVVTDGPNPVSAASLDGSRLLVPSGHVGGVPLAVDATGAGDGLTAGLLAALVGGPWPPSRKNLQRAIASGVRLGSEVAAVIGAQGAIPSEASA
jgi:sugar/nucleoside kinase (ribokinase family)